MANIAPNSTIIILKNVPLNNTYQHTIDFPNASTQINYFRNLRKFILDRQSYVRVNSGSIKIEKCADDVYDCNYIMFQNTAYGTKWFYAFITSVEYISNETCRIDFELDVMQSWYFDFLYQECFVEREHVMNDAIGANILPEPVELGEIVYSEVSRFMDITPGAVSGKSCIVASTPSDEKIAGKSYGGIYSGVEYKAFDMDVEGAVQSINDYINEVAITDPDILFRNIVAVFMCYSNIKQGTYLENVSFTKRYHLDGYVPRNNKLLTYPYNFLYVTNNTGCSNNYKYELFSDSSCEFQLRGLLSCDPEYSITPLNYKGVAACTFEKMSLKGFPQCTFPVDSYKAWLAQKGTDLATNTLSSAISGAAMGTMLGGPIGALAGAAGGLLTGLTTSAVQGTVAEAKPTEIRGAESPGLSFYEGSLNFYGVHASIRSEIARSIDDFFDMYGYRVDRVKVPNYNGRPHWNYVKTRNCTITGSVPAPDMQKICAITNNGITFWRNGSEVGNYSLSNK